MTTERIYALAVMDGCIAHAEKMIACLRHEGDERAAKRWDVEVIRQRAARAAVAELTEALPDLMALYRIKWGNLDPDASKVYERVEAALARVST